MTNGYDVVRRFWEKPFREKVVALRDRFLNYVILPVSLPWGGYWLSQNNYLDQQISQGCSFEKAELDFVRRFVQPGMTFFDLGAHHGLYTLLASKIIGAQGLIVAFEPSPRELRRLRWHIFLNKCKNVRVEPAALGSFEGTTELFVCSGRESFLNSLRPPSTSDRSRKVSVKLITLDHYLDMHRINTLDFIKMDVEGGELEVLKGATKLLNSQSRPVILSEVQDIRTLPWGYPAVEIYEFLVSCNYTWFHILPGGKLKQCFKKEKFDDNLAAFPNEKISIAESFIDEE